MAISEQEFEKVYARYRGSLIRRFADGLRKYDCDQFSVAEDLVQETFCKVWAARETYEGRNGSKVVTWVYAIATNVFLDYLRRRKPEELTDTAVCRAGLAISPSQEKRAIRREMAARITFILQKAPAMHRLLFWRRSFEEVPYDELVEEFRTNKNTLKTLVFRMNRRLRTHLAVDYLRP